MTASRSSPGPAPTTRQPRSPRPGAPRRSAPTRRSSWRRTTTGPTGGCSRRITARSPTRATCRSSSTTCPAGRARTSRPPRSCGSRSIRAIVAVKEASGNLEQIDRSAATGRAASRALGRRRLDPAGPRARRRRRRVGRVERDPGRDGGSVRRGARGRLGRGAAAPRALAAAVPGQLRRAQPGAGEGRACGDGPDRPTTSAAAAAARPTSSGPRLAATAAQARRRGIGRRPDRHGRRVDAALDGRRRAAIDGQPLRRTRRLGDRRSSPSSRPARSGPPSPIPTGPAAGASTPGEGGILLLRAPGPRRDWTAGPLTLPRPRPRRSRATRGLAGGRGAWSRAARPSRSGAHLGPASPSCRRRTSTSARGSVRDDGRLARAGRLVRADRVARPPRRRACRSAACWNRSARGR